MRGEAEADGGLDRPSKATAATVNGVLATGFNRLQATTAHLLSLQLYEKEQALQGQRSDNDLKLGIAQEMDASSLWLPQEDLYEDVRVLFSHQLVAKEYRSLFTLHHHAQTYP